MHPSIVHGSQSTIHSSLSSLQWNRKVKPTSFSQHTFNPDSPPMLLDDVPADSQSQSSPSMLARVGCIDLLKPLKNRFQLIGWNATTLVGDGKEEIGGR
jgi:hypothetical protein